MMIWYLLACFGATAILIEGKPTKPIRTLARKLGGEEWGGYLFNCYQCLGFWVGLALAFPFFWGDWLRLATAPLVSSGFCWALGRWVKSQITILIEDADDVDRG